ncbi:type III sulfide quinone reductase, selenoprotein subtype [Ornithinimicrobium sediminis]|uniref:type III sulfide quinone reductase, selenoprotein subtype n=1 Tax=Ornithinimicrobium sediminis TaxID=2904603 RepID=UPI001E38E388|nr:FAD/NAD(P)-binding oxidoreductase [Ornithinimicrobium sediminis]MCE0485241.1 NAD(P)/FAD-dependent oxidoreductase [Ornithinimicrobium sediminis]
MRNLVVLGAGTAGTMIVNKLRKALPESEWGITVVDRDDRHHYQPGYLFVPFGELEPEDVVHPRRRHLHKGVSFVEAEIDRIDPEADVVHLADGRTLPYDYLVVASGTTPRPDQTPGMAEDEWHRSIFDFYTLEGATALRDALASFTGGRLVMHITEMPIKCPVAPLEFSFLADAYFTKKGLRDKVEIVYVTPLDGAFTKPVASAEIGHLLADRNIAIEPEFMVERIDTDTKTLVSYDEREVPFDLLVTVPLNMGAEFVTRSGLGDELGFVPVDKGTMQSSAHANIFALGDASDIPTSKAGSVAHFSVEIFVDNFLQLVEGRPMTHRFDGHANCFIESGYGKGMLLDFNYDTEPLTGTFPLAKVGPLRLLQESRFNHLGKLSFRWAYWNVLLPGHKLPVPTQMSMAGKNRPAA